VQSSEQSIDYLKALIETGQRERIGEFLGALHPTDILPYIYEVSNEEAKYIYLSLNTELAAEVLSNHDPQYRLDVIQKMQPSELAKLLSVVDSDDAVDIVQELPLKFREECIASIEDSAQARYILDLLVYDKSSAGGLMAKELIKANMNWTVKQCIEEIRRQAEEVEKIYSVYVVDEFDTLQGRVSLKKIILARDSTRISQIFEKDVYSVHAYQSEEEVVTLMRQYDLESVPVVNIQGKLLGRITIDDIVDVITEQAEKERQLMSGISESVEEDDNIWLLSRARLPWLIIGMFGGLLGARFIGIFEDNLVMVPAMAFFIPLITATGGNVGIQSSSIVVQSLADRTAYSGKAWLRFLKLISVAGINGIVLSLIAVSFNVLLGQSPTLSLVVSMSLFSVVVISSVFGTITPLLLNRIGINPAVASGPFITTANDLIGLAVYFSVANLLL
jgi:magnesium transporter